jgi:gliding motility-associated-like protein
MLACHHCIAQCGNCETPIDVVINGDFEAGNIGFTSDHLFVPAPNILCPLCPEDRYAIGPNAQEFHNNFSGLDHTNPGFGNFMICNGDSLPNVEVWCQTVNVSPTTFYTFSFWASNITNNTEPQPYAQLQIRINGVLLPDVYEIDGDWEQVSAQWYSGNSNQLTLCILNQQSSGGGNDFGIDDISFFTCQPIVPAHPAALGNDQVICGGETIPIGMPTSGNYTYSWTGLPMGLDSSISNQLITFLNTTANNIQYEFVLNADTAGICNTTDSITITILPFEPLDIAEEIIICPYDSAQIILPAVYDEIIWSDGNPSSNRYLSPGEYSLYVSDNQCNDQANITVSVPPDPQLSLGNDFIGCSNNPPILQTDFTGIWSDGSASDSLRIYESGEYSFATIINGCNYADTIHIDLFTVPALNIGNDTILCEGESLMLFTGNDWDFTLWSTGAGGNSISVTQAGNYAVTAIIENCIARDTLQINYQDSIILELGNDRVLCEGEEFILQTPAPGIWNQSIISDSLVITTGGLYTFTYSPGECPQSDTIAVTYLDLPELNLGNDTSICAGAGIPLTVGNDWENVIWNNGLQQPSILASAGIVSVTASISNCTATDQIIIFPIVPIDLDLGADTTLCEGETLLLNPSATGLWNGISVGNEYVVTQAGTYTFEYGNVGCIQTDEIVISYDSRPTYHPQNDTSICRNNEVTLSASGWNEALWNESNEAITITAGPGVYTLQAAYGVCSLNDTIQISEIISPIVDLGADTILCENNLLLIQTEIPGFWNGEGPFTSIAIDTLGEYIFEYADGACAFADTIEVDFIELPPLLSITDTVICPWEDFTIQLNPWPGTISWANGSNSFEELMVEGNNIVTGQWNGCEVTETFTLSYFPVEILPMIPDTVVCSNPGLSIVFETPVEWSNGIFDNEILIAIDGSYSYFLESLGCVQTDTFQVYVQLEAETGLANEIALCGDEVTINTLVTGEWSDGQIGTTAIFQQAGDYSFHVVDSACNIYYPIQIVLSEFPLITLDESVSFCEDASAEITVEVENAMNYAWSDTTLGLTRTLSQPGVYTIEAENECGSITDSIRAEVFPCNFGLFIPTAFTPNEDNNNEGWRVQGFNLSEIDIKIYNRFGDLVFTTTDMETYWNPGLGIGDDIYNYRIIAKTFDGKTLREYGRIYLLR